MRRQKNRGPLAGAWYREHGVAFPVPTRLPLHATTGRGPLFVSGRVADLNLHALRLSGELYVPTVDLQEPTRITPLDSWV